MNWTATDITVMAFAIPTFATAAVLLQRTVQALLRIFWETVVTTQNLGDSFSAQTVVYFLLHNSKSFGLDKQCYQAAWAYIKSEDADRVVFKRSAVGSTRLFLYRGAPLILSPAASSKKDDGQASGHEPVTLKYVKGTVDWHRLLLEAAELREKYVINQN